MTKTPNYLYIAISFIVGAAISFQVSSYVSDNKSDLETFIYINNQAISDIKISLSIFTEYENGNQDNFIRYYCSNLKGKIRRLLPLPKGHEFTEHQIGTLKKANQLISKMEESGNCSVKRVAPNK